MSVCKVHQHAYDKICSECVADAYRNGVQSRNGDMFYHIGYWNQWSRVLSPMDRLDIGQVEVDLTAIIPTLDSDWKRVRRINIRTHRTSVGYDDKLYSTLPTHVFYLMKQWIPDQHVLDLLLHEDLLPLIDWDKYKKVNNGGAALADILIRPVPDLLIV